MSLALAHETEHRSLSVLIVEDHRLVGEGLEVALRLDGFAPILSACESAEAVIEEGRRLAPDLVILDLQLATSATDAPSSVRWWRWAPRSRADRRNRPHPDRHVPGSGSDRRGQQGRVFYRAARAGPAGCSRRLGDPVTDAPSSSRSCAGACGATRQDRPVCGPEPPGAEVLGMIVEGMSAREMASESYVSVATVRTQIRSILQKLGVNSQLEAAAIARASGWQPPGR